MSFYRHIALLIIFITPNLFLDVLAEIRVEDDAGNKITLNQPASRIVSLAPNLTELIFSVGAGDKIVATVSHSDYPPGARNILKVGDAHNVDIESVMALMPDLIVSWKSGNNPSVYEKLVALGLTVYQSEPDTLEKIQSSLLRLGILSGTESLAIGASQKFQDEIVLLKQQYENKKKVRVFYQFWDKPIYTVNGKHLISRIIKLCGGENIYSNLTTLTPQISIEAILHSNPDIIIASGTNDKRPPWLDNWLLWPNFTASRNNQLYFIPPQYIQRQTTRISHGIKMVCEFIDKARDLP